MRRSRFTEKQIITILNEHGVSEASIYKWKACFSGMEQCGPK